MGWMDEVFLALTILTIWQPFLIEAMESDTAVLNAWNELLSGPLSDRGLVLYLDPSLEDHLIDGIMSILALHKTSQVFVDIGSNGSLWCEQQTPDLLRGGHLMHIVILQSRITTFFQTLSVQWKPMYLMFVNVGKKSFLSFLRGLEFQKPQNLLLIEPSFNEETYILSQFYLYTRFPFSKKEKNRHLGIWNPETFITLEDIFIDRFPSFEGYKFLLGTWFDDYPYLHQATNSEEGVGDGVEVEMLDAMGKVLDFTYNLTTKPPDLQWGDFTNGAWTGMLRMIYLKEKNFTVNYFGYTTERMDAFDASVSYWNEGFGMALLTPPPLPKWRSLYYPFANRVWMAVIVTFVITTFILYIQNYLQKQPFLDSFSQTWLYLLLSLLNYGWPRLPHAQWQRLFLGWWSIFCFVVTTAYTANLIAFLTIPVFPARIQTVEQLAESDYRISMYDYGEFVPDALRSSQDPHYRMLGQKLDLYPTDDESMYPFRNGTHAYLESYSYSLVYIFDVYQVKNAYMLHQQLYPGHLCWYFQKNTAWKSKFDVAIQKLVESGLIAHWLKIKTEAFLGVDYERKLQSASEERNNTPLTLGHVQGVFFILIFGWIISSFIFILEIMIRNCCN